MMNRLRRILFWRTPTEPAPYQETLQYDVATGFVEADLETVQEDIVLSVVIAEDVKMETVEEDIALEVVT